MRARVVAGVLAIGALAACARPARELVTAPPGRSVSIYMPVAAPAAAGAAFGRIALDEGEAGSGDGTGAGSAVAEPDADGADAAPDALGYVDDRRWIELAPGGELDLADLPATADLDSLIVEPLGEPAGPDALSITQCTRTLAIAGALADLAGARGLIGRAVVARLSDGTSARGTVRAVDDDGLWLDDAGRAVRVDGRRVLALRVAGPGGATGRVRCRVRGAPGRHLVRVAYATTGVAWRAVHRIEVALGPTGDAGTALVRTGFEIVAPGWTGDADVALWRGLPGAGDPPEQVWSGSAGLGSDVTVWGEPRRAPAHLITVYRGAAVGGAESPTDPYWRQQSQGELRAWLVVDAPLPPGAAVVAVTTGAEGPARVAQADAVRDGDTTRVPLWTDASLRGFRVKSFTSGDDHVLREHLAVSIANLAERAREVWVEEELRPTRHRDVQHARPAPTIRGGWLRWKLVVPPGGVVKAACDLSYDL